MTIVLRPSPAAALKPLVGGALALPFVAGCAWLVQAVIGATSSLLLILLPVAGAAALGVLGYLYLALTTTYYVEPTGIRVQTRFLAKAEQRVAWRKFTSIAYQEGPVDRVLGLSRVTLTAYGQAGTTLRLVAIKGGDRLRDDVSARIVAHATLATWLGDD